MSAFARAFSRRDKRHPRHSSPSKVSSPLYFYIHPAIASMPCTPIILLRLVLCKCICDACLTAYMSDEEEDQDMQSRPLLYVAMDGAGESSNARSPRPSTTNQRRMHSGPHLANAGVAQRSLGDQSIAILLFAAALVLPAHLTIPVFT